MSTIDTAALKAALQNTTRALSLSPRTLAAVALVATSSVAQAQLFGGAWERAGGVIGHQVGRTATGSAGVVAGVIGEVLGAQIGRQVDEQTREHREADRQARAKIESVERDRAMESAEAAYAGTYDAVRSRQDPGYAPGREGYPGLDNRLDRLTPDQMAAHRSAAAAYRSAYDSTRQMGNPSYRPGSDGYPGIAQRAGASVQRWGNAVDIGAHTDRSFAQLQQQWERLNRRNAPSAGSVDRNNMQAP